MEEVDENQNFTNRKNEFSKDFNSVLSQHEALRRATLLKHRKVSTQLKLDMVHRQLSTLRSTANSANDRQFYRHQISELSSELQELGSTLDKAEQNAFYAKKRLMRHCGMDLSPSSDYHERKVDLCPSSHYYSSSTLPLSSSNPSLCTSTEDLRRSASRCSLKDRVRHLMASPGERFKKRHFFGELRAAASLSSLNVKSGSPTSDDSDHPTTKEHKSWKAPLRFLGHLYDTRFRRKLWGGPIAINNDSRTKSEENILEDERISRSRYEEKHKRISRTKSEEHIDKRNGSEENILEDKRTSSSKSKENINKRTRSEENILEDKRTSRSKSKENLPKRSSRSKSEERDKRSYIENNDKFFEDKRSEDKILEDKDNKDSGMEVITSSSSEDEESDEYEEWVANQKVVSRYAMKGPVLRKISQKAQVDPAVMAEIEDFEKMAAKYIKKHS